MRLYPLPQSCLESLRPILQALQVEQNMLDRTDLDVTFERLEEGYLNRVMSAYVDNVDTPKHCLILGNFPTLFTRDRYASVLLIYSAPEERGNREALKALMETIENFARLHGLPTVKASSWKYRGSRAIDVLWKRHGYEVQETVYMKSLL